jgi:hypothetical protein
MQNRATLRNALRKRNYETPSVSNDMQSSETLRNSLDLNYKSAALNQLSYAGVPIRKPLRVHQAFVRNRRFYASISVYDRPRGFAGIVSANRASRVHCQSGNPWSPSLFMAVMCSAAM